MLTYVLKRFGNLTKPNLMNITETGICIIQPLLIYPQTKKCCHSNCHVPKDLAISQKPIWWKLQKLVSASSSHFLMYPHTKTFCHSNCNVLKRFGNLTKKIWWKSQKVVSATSSHFLYTHRPKRFTMVLLSSKGIPAWPFIYRASVAWNSLSDELHNANSVDSFKSNLKRYLRTNTAEL